MRFLKKLNRIATWPRNAIPEYISQRLENRRSNKYMHTHVQSSIIHTSKTSTNRSMRSIHILEYYPALKRNQVLIHATAWWILKTCKAKEASRKEPRFVRFHLCGIYRTGKFIETESRSGGCQGLARGGNREDCLVGVGFPFGTMKIFLN